MFVCMPCAPRLTTLHLREGRAICVIDGSRNLSTCIYVSLRMYVNLNASTWNVVPVLQCVAVCCSVSVLKCAAVRCSMLQCVIVRCGVWQCVAVCCSVL